MFERIFLLTALCFFCATAQLRAREVYVVRVEGGGAVVVSNGKALEEPFERYFFYGIDVPTERQPYGQEALDWLNTKLPEGAEISVESVAADKAGDLRALIQLDRTSINYQLVYEGLAWVNRAQCRAIFCRRWYIQEHQAVVEKRGLWSLQVGTPPWQWSR